MCSDTKTEQEKMILPNEIDQYIFGELEGVYEPDPKKAKHTECSDEGIRRYLGTYWPRSFVELYKITEDLVSNQVILEIFKQKKELNILDIGSGTGGSFFGFLWFMKDNYSEFGFKNIDVKVYAIDGCKEALEKAKDLIDKFFPSVKYHPLEHKFTSKSDFENKISEILNNCGRKFDIVMCCKFVNEFYRKGKEKENENMYKRITEIVSDFMKEDGLFVLLDVTDPISNGSQKKYISTLMNREIIYYLRNEGKLNLVIPLSCAFWYKKCTKSNCFTKKEFYVSYSMKKDDSTKVNDLTKVSYKIFAFKNKAEILLQSVIEQDKYKISPKNICEKGSYPPSTDNVNPEGCKDAKDAFSFKENLEENIIALYNVYNELKEKGWEDEEIFPLLVLEYISPINNPRDNLPTQTIGGVVQKLENILLFKNLKKDQEGIRKVIEKLKEKEYIKWIEPRISTNPDKWHPFVSEEGKEALSNKEKIILTE